MTKSYQKLFGEYIDFVANPELLEQPQYIGWITDCPMSPIKAYPKTYSTKSGSLSIQESLIVIDSRTGTTSNRCKPLAYWIRFANSRFQILASVAYD